MNENIGGHATAHLHLERALRDVSGVDADFLHVPPPGLPRRLVGARVPGLDRLDLDLKPLRAQLAVSAWVRRHIRERVERYDAVYVYTHNAALLSADLLRNRPSVVGLDTTNAQNAYRLPYRRPTRFTPRVLGLTQAFERRVYDAATLVLANSEWAAASLREDYGVRPERIRIVPAGISAPAAGDGAAFPSDLPRVTFIGRTLERKGGNLLLAVHREHFAGRCVLTLVTPERVAPQPGVEVLNDVRPGDPRLAAVLRASRMLAFPSEIDMFPNVVLEAMAAGIPVVAGRAGAMPEMIGDGEAGILVEPRDARSVRDAIETLLDDEARAARLGAAARRRFEELFDVRVTAARFADVLREGIDLDRARRGRK